MSQTPKVPTSRAVGDEDPDFSPMTDLPVEETPAMTRRGADGRAHKVDELEGKRDERKKRRPLSEGTISTGPLRGAPD